MNTMKSVGAIISYIQSHEQQFSFKPDCIYVTRDTMDSIEEFIDRNVQLFNTLYSIADMSCELTSIKIMGVDVIVKDTA